MNNQGARDHPRNALNTVGQQRKQNVRYEMSSSGPQNNLTWTALAYIGDTPYAQGQGRSIGQAQDVAAQATLKLIDQGY